MKKKALRARGMLSMVTFRNPGFSLPDDLPSTEITSHNYCLSRDGAFNGTSRDEMSQAMSEYKKVCREKPLALFFHGGLVDETKGLDGASKLYGPYLANTPPEPQNGLTSDSWGNAYPFFFIWESGLAETLEQSLPGITNNVIFRRLLEITGPAAARAVKERGSQEVTAATMLRTPTLSMQERPDKVDVLVTQDEIEELQREIENDPIINAEKRRIARAYLREPSTAQAVAGDDATLVSDAYLSSTIVASIVAEERLRDRMGASQTGARWNPLPFGALALGGSSVLVRVARRYAQQRNHNFHNTVVEEIFRQFYISTIGSELWERMKRATEHAFAPGSDRVGTAMLAELIALYDGSDAGPDIRVVLIGHSAGCIYISNFLAAADRALRGKPYSERIRFDVIFMAPAIRADLFAETLRLYRHRIGSFRAFTMHDDLEAAEILLQVEPPSAPINIILAQVYTSSLLYFISGCLEDRDDDTPLVGMERFLTGTGAFEPGSMPAVDAVRTFLTEDRTRLIYSDTSTSNPQPALGFRCGSHHHGGFPGENGRNDVGGTLESVCYLLRTGTF